MPLSLDDVAAQYRATQENLKRLQTDLDQVGGDIKSFTSETKQQYGEVAARVQSVEQMIVARGDSPVNSFGGGASIAVQAMSAITDDNAFAHLREGNIGSCRARLASSIKAALTNEGGTTSEGGYIPSQPGRRGIVEEAARPLRLLEVLPSRPTTNDSVEFIQLNADGDASEQDKEGDEKAETDLEGVLVKAEIATIAGHTTASKQVLNDHQALQGAIDRTLRNKVLSRLEHQIINGSGAEGKIDGLLNQATLMLPTIAQTPADRIGEAMVAQANNGYTPNLVLLNPLDWFRIQITKTTADEEYVFGSPTMPVPPALWNAVVIQTSSMPEGTAMTVDTSYVTVLDREQPSVMLSNSHKDYFTRNLIAILGELRAGLEVLDGFAVYKLDLEASGE